MGLGSTRSKERSLNISAFVWDMEGLQDGLAFQEDTTNVLLIQDAQTELPNKTLCQGISQVSFPYKLDDMG